MTTNSLLQKCLGFIRKTYYGNEQSDHDALEVCRKYNLSDKSDAIRLALHITATSDTAQLPAIPAKRGRPTKAVSG